ncbi:MAG TPA: AAA family ATPase [Thermomicrobiales bacterium]|nr:AAA family ATPase [Thermomicrobiales bacterium]
MNQTGRQRIVETIDRLIRARYPLIAVNTQEERRFKALLDDVLQLKAPEAGADEPGRHFAKGLYWWSRVSGLRQVAGANVPLEGRTIPDCEEPSALLDYIAGQDRGIFLLCDFAPYLGASGLEDPLLARQVRELAQTIKPKGVTVLCCGPEFPALPSLDKEVYVYDLPLPGEDEIGALLEHHLAKYAGNPLATLAVDEPTARQLVEGLLGLTLAEAEYALDEATLIHRGLGPAAVPTLLEKKRDVVARSASLTYLPPQPLTALGGYAHLRALAEQASAALTPEARAFGVRPPKGFLLFGLPGCGKDHFTMVLSGIMGRALLRLDMGSVVGAGGGVIGSAATEIKRACRMAEICNAILVLSEFEKAVGGLRSSSQSDGGEVARMIAWLLNWMAEQEQVFVVATANDISQLEPEQIRQGRFGQVVFVDLPTGEDREAIVRVHLRRAGRDPERFDVAALAAATEGFSGAELAAAVQDGLGSAFFAGAPDVTDAHLLEAIRRTRPLSEIKAEQIKALRAWAEEHVKRPAAAGAAPTPQLAEL